MFKQILLILSSLILAHTLCAETTQDQIPADTNKPTWDQALKFLERGVVPGLNPIPESLVPPTKGVIHVREQANIDPEREYPILGKNDPLHSESIDPENERPILGSKGLFATDSIDPERERPIPPGFGQPGWLYGLIINKITIPGIGPGKDKEIDISKMSFDDYGTLNPPPGQVDFPKIDFLRQLSSALTSTPDLQLHSVHLSASTLFASAAIIAYKTFGLGGRQRALAALVPPQVLMDQLGRPGYRVPAHSDYTPDDVLALADHMQGLSDQELQNLAADLDPELLDYLVIVVDYVRQAQYQEYLKACPNPDLCT